MGVRIEWTRLRPVKRTEARNTRNTARTTCLSNTKTKESPPESHTTHPPLVQPSPLQFLFYPVPSTHRDVADQELENIRCVFRNRVVVYLPQTREMVSFPLWFAPWGVGPSTGQPHLRQARSRVYRTNGPLRPARQPCDMDQILCWIFVTETYCLSTTRSTE